MPYPPSHCPLAWIEYWQLDNEVTAPKNWPSDRYADYARLLAAFRGSPLL